MLRKLRKYRLFLVSLTIAINIAIAFSFPIFALNFNSQELQAKNEMISILKAQEYYGLKFNKFAKNLTALKLKVKSNYYDYKILSIEERKIFITGKAQRKGLKSYIGGAGFFNYASDREPMIVVSIICVSKKPTKIIPEKPNLSLHTELPRASCGINSEEVCSNISPLDYERNCWKK
ncbi:MAG TPA: type IV pilin-like G/H family protein [Allocoleopsis sp.]